LQIDSLLLAGEFTHLDSVPDLAADIGRDHIHVIALVAQPLGEKIGIFHFSVGAHLNDPHTRDFNCRGYRFFCSRARGGRRIKSLR